MMDTHDQFIEDDWTPEERALLASLPRERIPSSQLKTRTTDLIRRGGSFERPRVAFRRSVALIAAACLIFIAGTLVGYAVARRATLPSDEARNGTRQAVAKTESETPTNPPTRNVIWY